MNMEKMLMAAFGLLLLAVSTVWAGSFAACVVDESTGAVLGGVNVTAYNMSDLSLIGSVSTNSSGCYNFNITLPHPAAGSEKWNYTLTFTKLGYTSIGSYNVSVNSTKFNRVVNYNFTNLTMAPVLLAYINGTVSNGTGPVGNASVSLSQNGTPIASGVTNSSGGYSLVTDSSGGFTLDVSASGYVTNSSAVVLVVGSTLAFDVTLSPVAVSQLINTTVHVNSTTQAAVSGVTVTVSSAPNNFSVSGVTDSNGNVTLTGLNNSYSYNVSVAQACYYPWTLNNSALGATLSTTLSAILPTNVSLSPTYVDTLVGSSIAFTVTATDATGNPSCVANAWSVSNPSVCTLTPSGNTATVAGAAAGSCTLTVNASRDGTSAVRTATINVATPTVITHTSDSGGCKES